MDQKNMRQSCSRAAILIGTLLLISACYRVVNTQMAPTNTYVSPTKEPDKVIEPLTEEKLKNATYQLEEIGEVQLIDGGYENKYGDSATMVDRAGLLGVALGQLNDDNLNDAAVILWHNSGGSGTFIYLIALYNDGGEPRQGASKLLGDRVQVESLTIQSRQIVLQAITHGADDPLCCPSQKVTWIYTCDGDRLTQIIEIFASPSPPENTPEPEPTPIPAASPTPEPTAVVEKAVDALAGTQWNLISYRNQDGELVDVPEGASATAAFKDGKINGKAGCNTYFGSYEAGDIRIEFSVLGQTEMYCMEPEGVMELETAYLQALSQSTEYTIEEDTLTFSDGEGSVVVVFGPEVEQNDLIGSWQWKEMVTPVGSIMVEDPSKYVLEFLPNGAFNITADCNSGSGTYALVDNTITLEVGPMTLVACPEGSLGNRFVRDVNSAAFYFIEEGYLYIDLMMDSGTLRFGR